MKELAGGLSRSITIAKVMLTRNLGVTDGVVSSTTGIVTGFYPEHMNIKTIKHSNPNIFLLSLMMKRWGRKTDLS